MQTWGVSGITGAKTPRISKLDRDLEEIDHLEIKEITIELFGIYKHGREN